MNPAILWMMFTIVAILCVLLWIALRGKPLEVMPVSQFTVTLISREFNMNRYRAAWNPSPTTFVEKHELRGSIAGAPDAVLVADVPASAFEVFFDVADGAACNVYLRTTGDNTKFADSQHVLFTSSNEESVAPVENFGVTWVSHTA